GGQHAVGVACQEEHVARVLALAREFGIGNVLQRIGGAGVFGDRGVVEIGPARGGIDNDVFQDAAEAQRLENLRLVGSGEMNALGIAAALEIEDAVLGPAVLVVADQAALGIGGERGFAGARK